MEDIMKKLKKVQQKIRTSKEEVLHEFNGKMKILKQRMEEEINHLHSEMKA